MTRVFTVPPKSRIGRSTGLTELRSEVLRSLKVEVLMATPVVVTVPCAKIVTLVLAVMGRLMVKPVMVDDENVSTGSSNWGKSIR